MGKTTLKRLAELVIRQHIIEALRVDTILEVIDELIEKRVQDLILIDKTIEYRLNSDAFTCELTCSGIDVIKHDSLQDAIDYTLNNLGEIQIVYNESIVSMYETAHNNMVLGYANSDKLIQI